MKKISSGYQANNPTVSRKFKPPQPFIEPDVHRGD
jgi:hypothetical protein